MTVEFYPTDSPEVFSEQDSKTKKDLWKQMYSYSSRKTLIIREKPFPTLWQFVLESTKVINHFHGLASTS